MKFFGFRPATPAKAMASVKGRFVCLVFECEGRDFYQNIFPWFEHHKIPATLIISTDEVCRKFADSRQGAGKGVGLGTTTPTRMTWKNLRHMLRMGWEIGTNGLGPVNLTELSYKEQRFQIRESRRILSERLGQPPELFAYPGGAYCASSSKCVREEGFRMALTRNRSANSRRSARLHLGRLTLSGRLVMDVFSVIRCLARPPKGPKVHGLRATRPVAEAVPTSPVVNMNRGGVKAGAIP